MNDLEVLKHFDLRLENIDRNILESARFQRSISSLIARFKDMELDFQTK
jgi:hypothetical protein